MTRQLEAPIRHLSLTPTNRLAEDVYHQVGKGSILLDPPYQRGSVWTDGQRLDLMYSMMTGYPIGTAIFNNRMPWYRDGVRVSYAVIDGRQRLETICDWFDGKLLIPASWMELGWVDPTSRTRKTSDGPYVSAADLTEGGQRHVSSRMSLPLVIAQVDSIGEEAEIYRLVNSGGTLQTPENLARAARVARR